MSDIGPKDIFSSLFLIALAFIALREVLCWYWKLNALMKNAKEQLEELRSIRTLLGQLVQAKEKAPS